MIVITMTNCPPRVKGDITKWLIEINTGVYVGHVNARVREALWKRICDNVGSGQATMVYSTNNEQHMSFKIYNTDWKPVDFDGLYLIKKPIINAVVPVNSLEKDFSKAARMRKVKNKKIRTLSLKECIILDIETTGLNIEKDQIIEIGALKIKEEKVVDEYHRLICSDIQLSGDIMELTGLTDEILRASGIKIEQAVNELVEFMDGIIVLSYNAPFDHVFLEKAYQSSDYHLLENYFLDVLPVVKRSVRGLRNYKLREVAQHFGIEVEKGHRTMLDCYMLYEVILKLNEFL